MKKSSLIAKLNDIFSTSFKHGYDYIMAIFEKQFYCFLLTKKKFKVFKSVENLNEASVLIIFNDVD